MTFYPGYLTLHFFSYSCVPLKRQCFLTFIITGTLVWNNCIHFVTYIDSVKNFSLFLNFRGSDNGMSIVESCQMWDIIKPYARLWAPYCSMAATRAKARKPGDGNRKSDKKVGWMIRCPWGGRFLIAGAVCAGCQTLRHNGTMKPCIIALNGYDIACNLTILII